MKIPESLKLDKRIKRYVAGIFMECAHLFIHGEQQQLERKLKDQYDHVDKCLEIINEHNPTVLQALVGPKQ